jgi:ACR3 family arsenite transporter
VLFFSIYAFVFVTMLPRWLGLRGSMVQVTIASIAQSVGIYLGVPFVAGFVTWKTLTARKGRLGIAIVSFRGLAPSRWCFFSSPSS